MTETIKNGRPPIMIEGMNKSCSKIDIKPIKMHGALYILSGYARNTAGTVLANVVVTLYKDTGELCGSMITGSDGYYKFYVTQNQNYYVTAFYSTTNSTAMSINTLQGVYNA